MENKKNNSKQTGEIKSNKKHAINCNKIKLIKKRILCVNYTFKHLIIYLVLLSFINFDITNNKKKD